MNLGILLKTVMKEQLIQGLRLVLSYEVQNGLCFINSVIRIVGEGKKPCPSLMQVGLL